jgi:ABC-type nitrate/sulfonate/bicarbonate transport system ATPase subunit
MARFDHSLVVEKLSASYHNDGPALAIFDEVSFAVEPGEILGMFGSNGCGKSTLLRTILGLKEPTAGRVHIPTDTESRGCIAFVPQDFRASFFDWATLAVNIRMTLANPVGNWSCHTAEMEKAKQDLEIDLNLRLRPRSCSGGMLQQAAIIRAFTSQSRVLIADEPFASLDVNIVRKIRRAFRRIVQERDIAAMIVLHNLEDMVEVCDRVLVVPKLGFSTEKKQGFSHARIIKNENVERAKKPEGRDAMSFIDIAELILGTRGVFAK